MHNRRQRTSIRTTSTMSVTMVGLGILMLAAGFTSASPMKQATAQHIEAAFRSQAVTVCSSPECVATSEMIRSNMNTSFNPCDDFYAYACGNFGVNHKIPDDKSRYTASDVIADEVRNLLVDELSKPGAPTEANPLKYIRKFYQECSDEDKLKREEMRAVEDLVYEIAVIRKSKEQAIISAVNWTIPSFVSFSVGVDPNDTKNHILQLDQPSFTVSKTDLVANESDTKAAAIRSAYTDFVKAGLMLYEPDTKEEKVEEDAKKVVALEVALAKIAAKDEDRRNMSEILKRIEVDKLAEEIKGINLTMVVKDMLALVGLHTYEVLVVDINYMKQLGQVLDANSDVLATYHTWKVVEAYGGFLSESFTDARFQFLREKTGLKKKPDQKDICINTLVNNVPSVIGRAYIDASNFTDRDKEGAGEIIEKIRESMKRFIKEKQWMDEETRKRAIDKLIKITENIAYPEWIRNDTLLSESFPPELNVTGDSAFTLLQRMKVFLKERELRKLKEWIDLDHEWPMSPALVNAAYEPEQNSITFPAAILRGVFYQQGLPDYCNYGGIGAVVGHEITHGFDDQGAQYDADGKLNNWWSESTLNNFLSLTRLIVKQYSDVVDETTGLHLNGENTQGENIADNGGIREAYDALSQSHEISRNQLLPQLESFSPEQLFFVVYANSWCSVIRPDELRQRINTDPHSPAKYRTNLPLMNFEKFAEAFSCPQGSRMNPENKVRVW